MQAAYVERWLTYLKAEPQLLGHVMQWVEEAVTYGSPRLMPSLLCLMMWRERAVVGAPASWLTADDACFILLIKLLYL